MSTQSNEYQKGYVAGRKKTEADLILQKEIAEKEQTNVQMKNERVYLSCLALALEHCHGWSIGGKEIKDAEGYCTLAKVFAEYSIRKM